MSLLVAKCDKKFHIYASVFFIFLKTVLKYT